MGQLLHGLLIALGSLSTTAELLVFPYGNFFEENDKITKYLSSTTILATVLSNTKTTNELTLVTVMNSVPKKTPETPSIR